MLSIKQNFLTKAEELIVQIADRPTPARIHILAFLLSQNNAVSHQEIGAHLGKKEKIDRVTLYRVLDWLIAKGLVHKVISGDRAWRFSANSDDQNLHQHAHFKCNSCEAVVCLDEVKLKNKWHLPTGYRVQQVELTLTGICNICS